jgi:hypothetical protein
VLFDLPRTFEGEAEFEDKVCKFVDAFTPSVDELSRTYYNVV